MSRLVGYLPEKISSDMRKMELAKEFKKKSEEPYKGDDLYFSEKAIFIHISEVHNGYVFGYEVPKK